MGIQKIWGKNKKDRNENAKAFQRGLRSEVKGKLGKKSIRIGKYVIW
jgi:hypothetical protein